MSVLEEKVRVYKLKSGEYFEERIDDLESLLKEYFPWDSVEIKEVEIDGGTCRMYEIEPETPALYTVYAGKVEYDEKKTRFALGFEEVDPSDVPQEQMSELKVVIDNKNSLLEDVTALSAKDRHERIKRRAKID